MSCENDSKQHAEHSFSAAEVPSPYTAPETSTRPVEVRSSQLLVIDVSGNQKLGRSLDAPPNCHSLVGGLERLEVLRARRVGISRLPVSFVERVTSLRVLDVADNDIDAISETELATALARLRQLSLADNQHRLLITLFLFSLFFLFDEVIVVIFRDLALPLALYSI